MDLLWKPLLESAAQTIIGAISGYIFANHRMKRHEENSFNGPVDFWLRGVNRNTVSVGDKIYIDGVISPFSQLFPGNPLSNGNKWNEIYKIDGKIDSSTLQMLDFYSGMDAALRIGAINGETLVGIYHQFGYIGDGLVGVAPTSLLRKVLPEFFSPNFWGERVMMIGTLSKCPSQHGFVANSFAQKAGVSLANNDYKNLWYLNINEIKKYNKEKERIGTLIGSSWAVTNNFQDQYLVQYGYFQDHIERLDCASKIFEGSSGKNVEVFFDDIENKSYDTNFKRKFIA